MRAAPVMKLRRPPHAVSEPPRADAGERLIVTIGVRRMMIGGAGMHAALAQGPRSPRDLRGLIPRVWSLCLRFASLPQRFVDKRRLARPPRTGLGGPGFCSSPSFFTNGPMLRMCRSRENAGSKFTRKPISRLSAHVCRPIWGSVVSIELWPARKRNVAEKGGARHRSGLIVQMQTNPLFVLASNTMDIMRRQCSTNRAR